MNPIRSITRAMACAVAFSLPCAAQEPKPAAEPSWPELAQKDADRIALLVRKLEIGGETESEKARTQLVALGPGVVPHLLRRLALPRQTDAALAATAQALDAVVASEHAPLVAKVTDDRTLPARRWAMRWLMLHVDERWRDVYERHAGPLVDPKGDAPKDATPPDPEIRFCANLALAALRDTDALARVIEICHTQWQERAEVVGKVLPLARSQEMASWMMRQMRADDERSRVTGLRLLRSLAPKDYAGAIAIHLDAGEASVKREAINALRAVVDGAPPIETMASFTAIEESRKWKERLK